MPLLKTLTTISILVVVITVCSCRKQKLTCTGNCTDVKFAGRIINKATNTPISDQKVEARVSHSGICFLCNANVVGTAKSGRDGWFNITGKIDSTIFNDKHILVAMKTPDNYITYPEPVGAGLTTTQLYESISFYNIDRTSMENISFTFYPKVLLKILLHRISPVSTRKDIMLEFTFDDKLSIWGIMESEARSDTSITINTTANMFTKIKSYKTDAANVLTTKTDSILCLPNANNSISITY